MGGDSGSAWLIADDDGATDIMAGLHFAGEGAGNADEHALACYAHSVFKKLNISLELTAVIEAAAAPKGYNPHFLSEAAPTPKLTASQSSDAFKLDGSPLVPYMHFSVCQSKARRLPRFVAWNIDGKRLKKISRNGIGFKLDPRINAKFQVGNELYKNNKLDRGHVARRADLCWGPLAEAKKANVDSFFYTNITPQHEAFNQSSKAGLWGELENAIFEDVDVEDLKISVMGGPIFRDDDTEFRGVPLPREFWKLIAFQDSADGEFKVRAYVLTQRDLLTDLEALELDPFRLFQVSLGDLRVETKLNFQALAAFDTHGAGAGPEAVGGVSPPREVASAAELFA
jgi:endonuclease G